jgi:D-serine deaminase-like pyridoxal phosphate-dependent protein
MIELMEKQWYEILEMEKIDSPALVVFPERVKENILTAIRMTGDVSMLRPHMKTNKSPDVTRLMMEAGISKFKCATISEAEMLAICGAPDVLLAYQPLGPKLSRFIQLIQKYPGTTFSCLCDNSKAANEQSKAFSSHHLDVSVWMDLNVGMNRTGIIPGEEAIILYEFLSAAPGIKTAGLHAYDGHLRERDIEARTIACDKAYSLVEQLEEKISKKGLQVPRIIAGGSPTFPIHAKRKNIECSPGTFVYWDKGYTDLCPEQDFKPAAVLITRVISSPVHGKICTDLGHKSIAAENEISRRVFIMNRQNLHPVSQSEEHLVLENKGNEQFVPGDILYCLPYHICPTVALYERVYTIENGRMTGEWKNLARDRKINI